jgi:hypothetical protein
MLPKLILLLRLNAICLGGPLTQTQDYLAGILLKFRGVVKGALRGEGGLVFFEGAVDGLPRKSGFLGCCPGDYP